MRTVRSVLWFTLAFIGCSMPVIGQQALQFVPVSPCRVLDTRLSHIPIVGGTFQTFNLSALGDAVGCQQSFGPGTVFSLNVTVVPHGYLGYLTIWPTGQPRPTISLMNSFDGRIKANAAIVVAGGTGHTNVNVYVTNTADVILDVNGYFEPANSGAYAYYPLPTPCRLADTRTSGGPLPGGQEKDFPVLSVGCGVPDNVQAYSLNFTAVPNPLGHSLSYLTVWPAGGARPTVSTLNSPTGTIVANAALLPANGTDGEIAVFPSDTTDLVIDIDGYFAPATPSTGLALFPLNNPCRSLDTRPSGGGNGPFSGQQIFNIAGSQCHPPAAAAAYVMNATAIPTQGYLGYLTLWPGGPRPLASTLNAIDGAVTSNMAITGNSNGSVNAYAAGNTNLLLDMSGYMAPPGQLAVATTTLSQGLTGQRYLGQLSGVGGEPPYTWTITNGSLPPGITLTNAGVLSGIPNTVGSYPFTVKLTDQFNSIATAALSINVVQGTLFVNTVNLSNAAVGVSYSTALGAAGGAPPYTWSIFSGTLPDGLNLNPSTGVISGTPTTVGPQTFVVQATDQNTNSAQASETITVNAQAGNSLLVGHYAFSFNGYNNGQPVVMAGSFVADGAGNLTGGVIDVNTGGGVPQSGYSFTGTYSFQSGAYGLGDMFLTVPAPVGNLHFSFSLSSSGNGELILDNQDPNTRGSGSIFLQNPSAFQLPPNGSYAMGSAGTDINQHRYAKAGSFTLSSGAVSASEEDVNDNGAVSNRSFTGTFGTPDPQSGRGQVSLSFPAGVTNVYAYYIVSATQFLIVGDDPLQATDPLTLGTIQHQASGLFNQASLSGNTMLELTGLNPNGGNALSDIIVGLAIWNGGGGVATRLDENNGGTMSQATVQGVYGVNVNGRVNSSGMGGSSPIIYLTNFDQGFVLGQDNRVLSGILEQQTSNPPLGPQSVVGIYVGGTLLPAQAAVTDAVSYFQADGNGNLNGLQNYSSSSGAGQQSLTSKYSVDASGRSAVNPILGNLGGVMYIVSPNRLVLLPSGANPVMSTFSPAQPH